MSWGAHVSSENLTSMEKVPSPLVSSACKSRVFSFRVLLHMLRTTLYTFQDGTMAQMQVCGD